MSNAPPDVAAIVLLSGLDSIAALHWAVDQYKQVRAVTFDYGQPHARAEIKAARACAKRIGVPWELCRTHVRGTRKSAAPPGDVAGVSRANVPARNMLLLTTAAGIAATRWPSGLVAVVIGSNADDARLFPDCRSEFIAAADRALNLALDGVCRVAVIAPWAMYTKAQIVRWCSSRPDALRDARASVSCYAGTRCGKCDACSLRARAFETNGLDDQ